LALGLLNELLADGPPIVAAPCAKAALQTHPAYKPNMRVLEASGVTFVDQEKTRERGPDGLAAFRWSDILAVLDERGRQAVRR